MRDGNFNNRLGKTDQREMSFLMGWEKKRMMNNIASQSGLTKQRQSFQTSEKKYIKVLDIGNSKYKWANEMCVSVFIAGL